MTTQCTQNRFEFHPHNHKLVLSEFNGGRITSDGGSVLLREVERKTGIIRRLAACFTDHRKTELIEHSVPTLVGQRIAGLVLGYEDLNDHDQLRSDPVLALIAGKQDLVGDDRRRQQDRGKALAGKSTLNRLELADQSVAATDRYKKIAFDSEAADRLLLELYMEAQGEVPEEVILDLDATDDPVHGNQEGRFFHGYYSHYCYLPLYIFAGQHLLCARLRQSDRDASAGALDEVKRIVEYLRRFWPDVAITVRADSGFCRDEIMNWCEQNRVDYVLGLAKNERLKKRLAPAMARAQAQHAASHQAARVFDDFPYRTLDSWTRERRVIGKAEYLDKGENPRFVVTSFSPDRWATQALYEQLYCARGDMENRIKEQQLELFADRTSAATMRANQLRLYFSSFAYLMMEALRRLGLKGTEMSQAQCSTIRLKLLKIGALIRLSARRVLISLSSSYPYVNIFTKVHQNLTA